MRTFLRRSALYFLTGFVITFIIYLFVRFDAGDVILGVFIAAGGGIAVTVGLTWLGRRFPDNEAVGAQRR